MGWNEPNGNGSNWGGKKPQSPPDLDKILSDFWRKFCGFFTGRKNGMQWQPAGHHKTGFVVGVVAAIIFVLWLLSGLFIVNPAEQAVILRFGKFSDVLQPGLHWFARFIDTKYLVDVQKIYSFSIQGDFLTKSAEQSDLPNQYVLTTTISNKGPVSLDQSKNLVNVELNVQYRIRDPRAYLFAVVDPDETIKQAASGSLSAAVGKMKLDEVLTTGREILSLGVLDQIKQVILPYDTGLEVLAVTLRKVQAPDQVRAAFSDVNRADQDKATLIQQAQAYASKVVPIAQGMAARTLADANGYQQQVVLNAQANIAKYQAVLAVYAVSPEVTRERMYFDTMQAILQSTTKMLVDVNAGNNLIYLPLDKLLKEKSAQLTVNENNKMVTPQSLPLASLNNTQTRE
jgi:membrane protease subunit HflK